MKLLPDWKRIVKKAWSFRLNAIGFVFIGAEAAMPFFNDELAKRPMAIIAALVVVGAMVARIKFQKNMSDD